VYSHAAIYVGNEEVVHAVPTSKISSVSGARCDNLKAPDVAIGSTVCVLRWPGLTRTMASQVAAEARLLVASNARYDFAGISGGVWQAVMDWMQLKPQQKTRWADWVAYRSRFAPLYCSKLVLVAYFNALGSNNPLGIVGTRCPLFTPAEIYSTVTLNTISVP
jgi:hypothetical protein